MSELDLSKAVEAGADIIFACTALTNGDAEALSEDAITAALPHILDALADDADSKGRRGIGANGGTRATEAARYLRAKAEEVRDA